MKNSLDSASRKNENKYYYNIKASSHHDIMM
jgi:hypothetical protein